MSCNVFKHIQTIRFSCQCFYLITAGVFSEPQATFVFKRRVMFYVYGFYLPVVLVVLLSWISFWIDPDSTPARVSLGVITILAMGNFLHGGGATPNVSYATALDVYMITCFVFVFACLLEYAAVHCALNKSQKAEINEVEDILNFVVRNLTVRWVHCCIIQTKRQQNKEVYILCTCVRFSNHLSPMLFPIPILGDPWAVSRDVTKKSQAK